MKNRLYSYIRIYAYSALVLLAASAPALAQPGVPSVINYQGRLYDPSLGGTGGPLTGVQQVQFRIYDSLTGGTLIWGRQFPVSCTDEGLFNVLISDGGTWLGGATNHLSAAFTGLNRFLELTVVAYGDAIAPRQQLVSAPYAMQSAYAVDARQAGEGFLINNGLNVASGGAGIHGDVVVNNNLEVKGATTLDGAVHVKGNLDVVAPSTIAGFGTIPIGGIIMWSGSVASIPDGWALCDGGTHNSHATPNLRDRFIVGAGSTYAVGATGGAAEVTLTVAQIPAHSHTLTVKTVGYAAAWNGTSEATGAPNESRNNGNQTWTTNNKGDGHAHENRPPYYALCFIMRVK